MAATAVQESGEVRAVFDEEVSGSGATYYVLVFGPCRRMAIPKKRSRVLSLFAAWGLNVRVASQVAGVLVLQRTVLRVGTKSSE